MFLLVLLLTDVNAVMQEKSCKGNVVRVLGFGGSKVIFTLLTEVITFYVGLTMIQVR